MRLIIKPNKLFSIFLFLSILISGQVLAGFEEALEAYTRGDQKAAFEGFRAAAETGDIRAFGKLGGMYLYGVGTERDYARAYIWFGLADAAGDQYGGRFQKAASSMLEPGQLPGLVHEIEEYRKDFGLADSDAAGK